MNEAMTVTISLTILRQDNFSKWPTWRTIPLFYNTFITVLYMFRATSCSSSGVQIVLIRHLVSSLWKRVSGLKLLKYNYFIIRLLQSSTCFEPTSCSSSGGQIVLIHHLVSSLWKQVSGLKLLKYDYFIRRLLQSSSPLHVSSNVVLIIRRSNFINTASGIVTLKTSEWSKITKIQFAAKQQIVF